MKAGLVGTTTRNVELAGGRVANGELRPLLGWWISLAGGGSEEQENSS
jgi:hypothetical protein